VDNIVFVVCANMIDWLLQTLLHRWKWGASLDWKQRYFETSAQTGEGIKEMFQTFYMSIVDLCENGGKHPTANSSASFTKEQADTIRRTWNS
jgi:DnaJ family protein C protein 27